MRTIDEGESTAGLDAAGDRVARPHRRVVLAGVLKGQEMITSGKVKRIAGQLDEIRAAYLGFQDRFRALPGDYRWRRALAFECGPSCPQGQRR